MLMSEVCVCVCAGIMSRLWTMLLLPRTIEGLEGVFFFFFFVVLMRGREGCGKQPWSDELNNSFLLRLLAKYFV